MPTTNQPQTTNELTLIRYKVCTNCYRLHSENYCPSCACEDYIACSSEAPIGLKIIEERKRLLDEMTAAILKATKALNDDKIKELS